MSKRMDAGYIPSVHIKQCRHCGKFNDHEFRGQICRCASETFKVSRTDIAARRAVIKFLTLSPA